MGVQNLIKLTKRTNLFRLKNKNEINRFRSYLVTVKVGQRLRKRGIRLCNVRKNMTGGGC